MKILVRKYFWDDTTEANKVNFFSDVLPIPSTEIDLADWLVKDSLSNIEYTFQNIDENNSLYLEASNVSFKCYNGGYSDILILQDFFEIYNQNQFIRFKCKVYDDDNVLVYTGVINKDGINMNNRSDNILDITTVGYEAEFKNYYQYEKIIPNGEIEYSDLPYPMPYTGFRVHKLTDILIRNFAGVQFKFLDELYTTFMRWYYVSDKPYTFSPAPLMYEENLLECKSGYESFYKEGTSKYKYLTDLCLSKGWVWYFYLDKLYIKQLADKTLAIETIDYNETFIKHDVINETQNFQIDNVIVQAGEYYANEGTPFTASFPLSFNTTGQGWKSTQGQRRFVFSYANPEVQEIRAFRKLIVLAGNYYLPNHSSHNTYFLNNQDDYNYSFTRFHTVGAGTNQVTPYTLTSYIYDYGVKKSMYIPTGVCQRANGGFLDITNARTNTGRYYGNGNSYADSVAQITNNEYGVTGNIGESMIRYDVPIGKYFTYEMDMRSEQAHNNFRCFLRNANQVILNITVYGVIKNPYQNIKILNYPYYNINDKIFIINKLSFNLLTKQTNLTIQLI